MTTADDLRDLRDALDSIVHGALPRWGKPSTKTGEEAVRAAVELYEKYIRALMGEGAAQAATRAAKLAESDQREHAAALTARMQELEASYALKILEAEERGAKWAIDERGLHGKRDTRPMARELCERMRRSR